MKSLLKLRKMLVALVLTALTVGVLGPSTVFAHPTPIGAFAFEYLFWYDEQGTKLTYANTSIADPYGFTCTTSSNARKLGAWAKQEGYESIVIAVGNPKVFANMRTSNSTSAPFFFGSDPAAREGNGKLWLKSMKDCISAGYGTGAVIYLSFNNDTSDPVGAGNLAASWKKYGGFFGTFVNFEGNWNNATNTMQLVSTYSSNYPGGLWFDTAWNSGAWSYNDILNYVSYIEGSYGSAKFLYPQNYYLNMNGCPNYPINRTTDYCSSQNNPWVGSYVIGATVQHQPGGDPKAMWDNYVAQPYPYTNSAYVVVVMAYGYNVTKAAWQNW